MTGCSDYGLLVLNEREVYHCVSLCIKLVIYHSTWGHTQLTAHTASRTKYIEIFIRFEHFFISYLLRHYLCAMLCSFEADILAAVPVSI